jgi:Rrf2 family transcriptional regulator, iron-sulfur cluster assembly transcription factor
MAMVELAARQQGCSSDPQPGRPVSLAELAQAQLLSLAYLEQLFGHLRRSGLVASARGPGGGYRLARPATSITVAEIVDAVDEPIRATRCKPNTGTGCQSDKSRCLTHDLWEELTHQIHLFLSSVSLADVVNRRILGKSQLGQPLATDGATPPASIGDEPVRTNVAAE